MIATEFGAIHRGGDYPVDDPGTTGSNLRSVPEFERDKYLYDMRTKIESLGGGWSVFGYTSTWGMTGRGVYLQRFNLGVTPICYRSSSRDGSPVFDPNCMDALFGDSRPSDGYGD